MTIYESKKNIAVKVKRESTMTKKIQWRCVIKSHRSFSLSLTRMALYKISHKAHSGVQKKIENWRQELNLPKSFSYAMSDLKATTTAAKNPLYYYFSAVLHNKITSSAEKKNTTHLRLQFCGDVCTCTCYARSKFIDWLLINCIHQTCSRTHVFRVFIFFFLKRWRKEEERESTKMLLCDNNMVQLWRHHMKLWKWRFRSVTEKK